MSLYVSKLCRNKWKALPWQGHTEHPQLFGWGAGAGAAVIEIIIRKVIFSFLIFLFDIKSMTILNFKWLTSTKYY